MKCSEKQVLSSGFSIQNKYRLADSFVRISPVFDMNTHFAIKALPTDLKKLHDLAFDLERMSR